MTQGQYILCHIFTNDTRRLKIKYEEKYLQKESKGHLEMNVLKSLQTEIYENTSEALADIFSLLESSFSISLVSTGGGFAAFDLRLLISLTADTRAEGWGVVAGLSEKSQEYKTLSTVVPCSL